jgi:hypothetical protein
MGAYTTDADIDDRVLSELDGPSNDEHPDVNLIHESEWCRGAFCSGLVVWGEPRRAHRRGTRHMRDVPRDKVRRLWLALAAGDIYSIEPEPWRGGYG